MEIKQLIGFVLTFVLAGLLIGVGVLTMDKMADSAADSTGVNNESVTFAAGSAVTVVGTLSNNDITSISSLKNASHITVTPSNYTYNSDTGRITVDNSTIGWGTGTYYASYVYDKESSATYALRNSSLAVGEISTTWMSLIVTISILAIILTLVIRSFAFGRR